MVAMVPPCVSSTALVFCTVLMLGCGFKLQDNHRGNVEPQKCLAPVAIEGQTAELIFFIRHDALQHETFFATLRRHRDLGSDILVCDRNSPVKCHIVNNNYNSGQIVNDSLTLQIPHVTRDFEDTYVLQAYADNLPEPSNECQLRVIGKQKKQRCLQSEVSAGEIAVLEFSIAQDVLSDRRFFANLKRTNKAMSDIVVCGRNSPLKCDVFTPGYVSGGIENDRLTVYIPDVSKAFEDTYVFQVYKGRHPEDPVCRQLLVRALGTKANNEVTVDSGILAAIVIVAVLLLPLLVSLVIFRERIKAFCQQTFRGSNRHHCSENKPGRQDGKELPDNVKYVPESQGLGRDRCGSPPSYSQSQEDFLRASLLLSRDSEGNCLAERQLPLERSETNTQDQPDGVREEHTNDEKPVSKTTNPEESVHPSPNCEDEMDPLLPKCGTDHTFVKKTDGHLPDQLRTNSDAKVEVTADGQQQSSKTIAASPTDVVGSPAKPIETVQPKMVDTSHIGKRWFVARLSDRDVKTRFSFRKNKVGSFLITQDHISPRHYTLTVLSKQKELKSVPIDERDAVFTVRDGGGRFDTLCDLVDHFRNHDIGERGLRLHMPCEEEPNEAWYFGKLARQEVDKMFSPERVVEGTFAVYDSVTDEQKYTLSVVLKSKKSPQKAMGTKVDFTIRPSDDGFNISNENKTFGTLAELIYYFKRNELTCIRYKHLTGKLCFACEKLLTAEDEKILKKNGPGSYFIKPYPVSNQQLLAVNTSLGPRAFTIIQNSKGFRLDDVDTYQPTHSVLIHKCRNNGITMHGTDYGRLRKDCSHDLEEEHGEKK